MEAADLLLTNVKQSAALADRSLGLMIPDALIEVVDERSGEGTSFPPLADIFARQLVRPIPFFYRGKSGELISPQLPFFGIYSLAKGLRAVFLGVRHLQAGDLLRSKEFHALSVSTYYAGSLHLLHGYLALYGHVLISPVVGPPRITKRNASSMTDSLEIPNAPGMVAVIHTRENDWKVEGRTRQHAPQWRELKPVFSRLGGPPDFFSDFFDYVLSYEPDGEPVAVQQGEGLVDAGIRRLADVRHEAVYGGYGYDDFAYDALANLETDFAPPLGRKSLAYRSLAIGLLDAVSSRTLLAIGSTDPSHWECLLPTVIIGGGLGVMEFGEPAVDTDDEALARQIRRVYSYVFPPDR